MLCLRSQFALFTNVFLSCVSFAIVMPSLWPYLSSLNSTKAHLAVIVAIYSVGEAVGAISFSMLALPTRHTLTLATFVGGVGSLLYVLAEAVPLASVAVLLARFLQGVWTGACQAVQQVYLSDVLPTHELTATTVTLNAYACLGFVVGPAFALGFNSIPEFVLFPGLGLHVNQLTAPGYFVLLSAVFCAALLLFVFDEPRDRATSLPDDLYSAVEKGYERTPLLKDQPSQIVESAYGGFTTPLMLCNVAFFTHFYGFALQETITTPLVQTFYAWTVFSANLLFTFAGICALTTFLFLRVASRYLSDRLLTQLSLCLGCIGYLLLLCTPNSPLSVGRFLTGFAIISVAFPMGRAVVISLYTKLLPAEMQGAGQGVILAVGALARIVGPFWAVRAFYMAWGPALVFGVTAAAFAVCMALFGAHYRRFET